MTGKEQLKKELEQVIILADENPCRMGDALFVAFAIMLKEFCKFMRRKKELCRREVAKKLNTTERQIYRLMEKGKIPRPHRDGDRQVKWWADEIEDACQSNETK